MENIALQSLQIFSLCYLRLASVSVLLLVLIVIGLYSSGWANVCIYCVKLAEWWVFIRYVLFFNQSAFPIVCAIGNSNMEWTRNYLWLPPWFHHGFEPEITSGFCVLSSALRCTASNNLIVLLSINMCICFCVFLLFSTLISLSIFYNYCK